MNVVNYAEIRQKQLLDRYLKHLRRIDRFIEFTVIPDYEYCFDEFTLDRLEISDVYIHLAKTSSGSFLTSILFEEDEFDIKGVCEWLDKNDIQYFDTASTCYVINNCSSVTDKLLFEGKAIINYVKGHSSAVVKHRELEDVFESNDVFDLICFE